MMSILRTTSWSESENKFFQSFHTHWETLLEFWIKFESAMEKQRYTNDQLNFENSKSIPMTETSLKIEKDAAEIYTRSAFYDVQEQIKWSMNGLIIQGIDISEGVKTFILKDKNRKNKVFQVFFLNGDSETMTSIVPLFFLISLHF